jgi:CRP-like cAMP-binding protein
VSAQLFFAMLDIVRSNIGKIIVGTFILLLSAWFLSKPKTPTKRPSVANRAGLASVDDGLLSEKRLKPMYKKLSKKVGQSFKWLEKEAKSAEATLKSKLGFPRRRNRGDGLNSIFSDNILADDFPMQSTDPDIEIENVRADILDENQRHAFSTLFKWGIFEGAELSILNELCSNATVVNYKKGDTIYSFSDCDSRFLYVLKSGTCDVSFLMPDGTNEVVYDIASGSVIASVVDVISWIVRSDIKRHVVVQCTSACDVIAIPSPRDEEGKFQSRLHTASFARIVRMLLIRFNRTTVTTALFYLGLAEHFLPSFPRVSIPDRLSELCSEMPSVDSPSSCDVSSEKMELAQYEECLHLVKTTIASLYGISADEVELPQLRSSSIGAMVNESAVSSDKIVTRRSISHASSEPSAKFQRKRSNTDVDEEDELLIIKEPDDTSLSIPPPIAFTRAGSHMDQTKGDGFGLAGGRAQRKLRTGICLMREGQSILDVDAVPGMYIIISGKVEIIFLGTNNLKRVTSQRAGQVHLAGSSGRKRNAASSLGGGEIIGQISILAGSSSEWYGRRDGTAPPVMSVVAVEDTWLLRVPMQCYEKAITRTPEVIFHLSTRIIGALPPLIRLFDFCTKWMRLKGGDDIVTRGQAPTGELYVVLCGRMRVLLHKHAHEMAEQGGDYSWSYSAGGRSAEDEELGLYGRSNDWIIGRGTLIGKHVLSQLLNIVLNDVLQVIPNYSQASPSDIRCVPSGRLPCQKSP